jgi:hypothetical protein
MLKKVLIMVIVLTGISMLSACSSAQLGGEQQSSPNTPAVVESVVVELQDDHYYARVTGTYPDACTRISDVQQDVEANSIEIALSTAAPPDVMCAMILAPYEVQILLETGGLAPGDYQVDVNGVSATFTLGE